MSPGKWVNQLIKKQVKTDEIKTFNTYYAKIDMVIKDVEIR